MRLSRSSGLVVSFQACDKHGGRGISLLCCHNSCVKFMELLASIFPAWDVVWLEVVRDRLLCGFDEQTLSPQPCQAATNCQLIGELVPVCLFEISPFYWFTGATSEPWELLNAHSWRLIVPAADKCRIGVCSSVPAGRVEAG